VTSVSVYPCRAAGGAVPPAALGTAVTPPAPSDGLAAEPLSAWRDAEPFEELRRRFERCGEAAAARLVELGDGAPSRLRASLARDLLSVLGCGWAANGQPAGLLVLCGSDDSYAGPEGATTARSPAALRLGVATPGSAGADALEELGVVALLHADADLLELGEQLLAVLEAGR
jgi:hypothetical protein